MTESADALALCRPL